MNFTDEEFGNNGERQFSSIPYVTLSHGIVLSESTLQATASRQRPDSERNRDKFTLELEEHRFKSHIPMVNSARINGNLMEESGLTARSSYLDPNPSLIQKE